MGNLMRNGRSYTVGGLHNYSTTEQVVGTWIDGKTLYEKTFTGLSVRTNGEHWVSILDIDASEWDTIVETQIYRTLDSGKLASLPLAESSISNDLNYPMITVVSSDFDSTVTVAIFKYTKVST